MAEPTDPKNTDKPAAKDDKSDATKSSAASKAKSSTAKVSTAKTTASKADNPAAMDKSESSKGATSSAAAGASSTTTTKSSSVPGTGASKPASAAKDDNSGGSGRFALWLVVIVALAGGGAFVTKDVWLPMAQPYLAKIPGLGGSQSASAPDEPSPIDALNDRIAALEQKRADSSANDSAMAALKAEKDRVQAEVTKALGRIADLEGRLKEVRELAQAVTSSGSGDVDLSPVMSRIDELENTGRQTSEQLAVLSSQVESGLKAASAGSSDGRASGLVLAIAQLRDTALSGQPYATQLEAFRALAGDNPDFVAAASRLAGTADAGLPTAAELSDQFNSVAGDIIALARSQDGDWLEQAAARMSSLVSIRRTDGQSGDPVEDAVAEIESRLASRDVPGAVQVASELSDIIAGEARTVLEGWLLEAKTRAGAERALNAIHTSALAALGG
jgi:hypothetical protein